MSRSADYAQKERERKLERKAFDRWYTKVDRIVSSLAGIGIDDLPDGPSWDSWASGATPNEYAIERLQEEGYPFI